MYLAGVQRTHLLWDFLDCLFCVLPVFRCKNFHRNFCKNVSVSRNLFNERHAVCNQCSDISAPSSDDHQYWAGSDDIIFFCKTILQFCSHNHWLCDNVLRYESVGDWKLCDGSESGCSCQRRNGDLTGTFSDGCAEYRICADWIDIFQTV